MYTLIIDGDNKSTRHKTENFDDALYWYDRASSLGAQSMALWCDRILIKYYMRGENNGYIR